MKLLRDIIIICVLLFSAVNSENYVTYDSLLKLINQDYDVRLHSHDIKYGTGSKLQSVTAVLKEDDVNSYWIIKSTIPTKLRRGNVIKCGEKIRLQHLTTLKCLHSNHYKSPLSGNQEISAFGSKSNNGSNVDIALNWIVNCNGDYWTRSDSVLLQHDLTKVYLSISGDTFGPPISGQMEVIGTSRIYAVYWTVADGVFIEPADQLRVESKKNLHFEL